MKRAKKSIPEIKEITDLLYTIECPHCKTYLTGGFNERTIMLSCLRCKNKITIDWENAKKVKKFSYES